MKHEPLTDCEREALVLAAKQGVSPPPEDVLRYETTIDRLESKLAATTWEFVTFLGRVKIWRGKA